MQTRREVSERNTCAYLGPKIRENVEAGTLGTPGELETGLLTFLGEPSL